MCQGAPSPEQISGSSASMINTPGSLLRQLVTHRTRSTVYSSSAGMVCARAHASVTACIDRKNSDIACYTLAS